LAAFGSLSRKARDIMRTMCIICSGLKTTTQRKSMKCIKLTSTSLMKVVACAVVALGAISLAQAQDKTVDPTGTWTWAQPAGGGRNGGGGGGNGGGGRGGAAGTNVLVLKLTGTNLTGTLTTPPRGGGRGRRNGGGGADATTTTNAAPVAATPIPISGGKVVGDTVSFNVTQTMGQNGDVTVPYTGKIAGNTITGTVTRPARGGGDPTPTPWTATKQP
jgi:hypothetical protein